MPMNETETQRQERRRAENSRYQGHRGSRGRSVGLKIGYLRHRKGHSRAAEGHGQNQPAKPREIDGSSPVQEMRWH